MFYDVHVYWGLPGVTSALFFHLHPGMKHHAVALRLWCTGSLRVQELNIFCRNQMSVFLAHGKPLSIKEKDPCQKAKIIIIIATSLVKQKFTRIPSPLSCSQGRGVKAGSLPEEVAS